MHAYGLPSTYWEWYVHSAMRARPSMVRVHIRYLFREEELINPAPSRMF